MNLFRELKSDLLFLVDRYVDG